MHDLLLVFYLMFLAAGNAFLIRAVYAARAAWREDIAPFGRKTSSLQVLMKPEAFVRPEKVQAVRKFSRIGFILLLLCLAAVITDIATLI